MKKILTAILFAGILLSASFSWAQENASATAQPSSPAAAQQTPPAASPTAPAAPLPAWLQYKPSYTGEENDISNPHRTTEEIATWAQQAAAEVLTFGRANYADRISSFKKYFIQQGWQLYIAYLKDTKVVDMVKSGYSVGAIVTEVPEIVNQGTSGGSYHWILRMPITISFFKKDPVTGETKTATSGKFFLFMDMLRVSEGGGEDGIAIDNWHMMDVPKN